MSVPSVLSFQSQVVSGRVGNSVAAFVLQRLGVRVLPVATATLSNHPGAGAPAGGPTDPADLRAIIDGLDRTGALEQVDAVLTGYMGSAENAGIVDDTIGLIQELWGPVLVVCDPVIGDTDTGVFVADGVETVIAEQLVPSADVIVPNGFELVRLTGNQPETLDAIATQASGLLDTGPSAVIVTSAMETGDTVSTLVVLDHETCRIDTPALPFRRRPDGAGDLFAAVFTAHLVTGADFLAAASRAAEVTHAILAATAASGAPDLQTVEHQDLLTDPGISFEPIRL